MKKAIVIGLDGGTFDILGPLMDRGELPVIKQLMESGVSGKLRTVVPPGTGPAWSSIVTGLDPSNHGVYDLIVRADDSYNLAFLNASSLRAPTMWDLVGAYGGTVLVFNVPMTFPPRKVNGKMVSGLLTPPGSRKCTYPADLLDTILGIDRSYKIVPTQSYTPGRIDSFLEELTEVVRSKSRVLLEMLKRTDWTFAMQVFNETDFLQHALWHVIDPEHPRHVKSEYERYAGKIHDFYRLMDEIIGNLVEAAGDEASVVIVSDHGHGPLHRFIHANNLLLESGLMKVKKNPASRMKYLLFKAGLTPLNVYKAGNALGLGRLRMGMRWTSKGYDMLRRLFFSFSDIDWPNTDAYGISGGVFGGLYVNLKGREPEGAVEQDRYEETRNRLEAVLTRLSRPEGGSLVRQVFRREEIYGGRFLDEAPDMLFLPHDPTLAVFGDFEFSSNRVLEPASEAISAQHRMDGIFIARGEGMRKGDKVENMSVLDVAPLLMYLMDLPIPDVLDGEFRKDLFDEASLDARPPSYCKADDVPGITLGERKSAEDDGIKQRLKGLGYIS
ncbi:MAG: alkaline phosphatase family protein [Candidatus Eisenbacteria bacterium]